MNPGNVGLGVQGGMVEFKDLKVTPANEKKSIQSSFANIDPSWIKNGAWTTENGVLKSIVAPAPNPEQRPAQGFGRGMSGNTLFMGDTLWTDVTIEFKMRKETKQAGIQVYFRNKGTNGRGTPSWNISGERSSLNLSVLNNTKNIDLEANRWYSVKLVVSGSDVKGYIDGKLVQEISASSLDAKSMNVSSMIDEKTGDIILKVVNSAYKAKTAQINLNGASKLTGKGTVQVLTSESALDENTLDQPKKVSPKSETIRFGGTTFKRTFPANSLTVLRLNTLK